MTETTPQRPNDRPGNDVVVAVVAAIALVIGGTVALSLRGDDAPDRLSGQPAPSADPFGEAPPATPPSQGPAAPPAQGSDGTCSYPRSSEPATKDVGLPPATPLPVGGKRAVLDTSAGRIELTLSAKAPCTTSSFAHLSSKGYFDGTPCHRLTTEGIFVLQCGDPSGQGGGGPGYTLPDEALEGATYPAGTVAMANTGQPGSGGSQFFLVYEDTQLPPTYTPWATVTAGLDVLRRIGAAGSKPPGDGAPTTPVTIRSSRIS